MKIFISWSGSISKKLAEAIRQWTPGVIQAAKPYYSPDDISKGSRWSSEIAKELDSSKIGIICLTKENLEAPWIMFEAGALSKNIDKSKVCPILFGIEPTDIQGPLVQFQAAKFSKDEMKKVIRMMNTELGDGALAPDVLDNVYEMWWPKLKESVEAILNEAVNQGNKSVRSDRDILEEVLELSRLAYISKERLSEKETKIHPDAIFDLCNGYLKVALEVQNFADVTALAGLIEEIYKLNKPLRYIVSRMGLSAVQKEKFMNVLDEANLIARRSQRLSSRNFTKEIDFGDELPTPEDDKE